LQNHKPDILLLFVANNARLEFRKLDDRNLLIANHLDQTIYLANQEWVLDRAAAFASPQAYCAKMLSQSHFTEPVKQKIY